MKNQNLAYLMAFCFVSAPLTVMAGAYVSSSGAAPDRITHPSGYTGSGGVLDVTVCINPSSESIAEMIVSVENVVNTFNELQPTTGNVLLGGSNDIPSGAIDFESTVLHEVGHCIGLAHPNLASESGLAGADRNYTKSDEGPNNTFDLGIGNDGLRGSGDDLRGDDINLHWFRMSNNNPFSIDAVVDVSTYSRDLDDLPGGDTYAANADRDVSGLFGIPTTEAVMQQGAFSDEDQRALGHDDVATLRLGMAGLDETQGTGDDYTLNLIYGGVASGCDVTITVTGASFAFCSVPTTTISGNHRRVTTANAQFGSAANFNWFFNPNPNQQELIFADGFEI
ncbi:MAG: hypothetical protein Tsb002_16150 [Wenzhouxiangellaceae bacterium]